MDIFSASSKETWWFSGSPEGCGQGGLRRLRIPVCEILANGPFSPPFGEVLAIEIGDKGIIGGGPPSSDTPLEVGGYILETKDEEGLIFVVADSCATGFLGVVKYEVSPP